MFLIILYILWVPYLWHWSLTEGFYKLNLNPSFIPSLSLYVSGGVKQQMIDENSTKLMHR